VLPLIAGLSKSSSAGKLKLLALSVPNTSTISSSAKAESIAASTSRPGSAAIFATSSRMPKAKPQPPAPSCTTSAALPTLPIWVPKEKSKSCPSLVIRMVEFSSAKLKPGGGAPTSLHKAAISPLSEIDGTCANIRKPPGTA